MSSSSESPASLSFISSSQLAVTVTLWGRHIGPFLSLLIPLFIPLLAVVADVPRPPLRTAFLPPCTKTAPTASSPESCLVAISRSYIVFFGCSRPSLCTNVQQVMLDQNTDITSALHILGSSWHFWENARYSPVGTPLVFVGSPSDPRGCRAARTYFENSQ
jgi:hypothetical protein